MYNESHVTTSKGRKNSKMLTFKGGVHPKYHKEISVRDAVKKAVFPDVAVVPLSQHIGAPNKPLVKKGDIVEEGVVIGTSESFISSPVHAPFAGKVQDIKKVHHPALGPIPAIFIERDPGKAPLTYAEQRTDGFSKEELIKMIRNAGLVGLGGATFPTHVKLRVPEGQKIDTLIINGAECEPYLTCDQVLMAEKTKEILKGVGLIIRIVGPKVTYIAIENNKKEVIRSFRAALGGNNGKTGPDIRIAVLPTKYPQGGEKQLISAISRKEVPPGKLPLDIGCLVQNVGTAFAIYEAICLKKPLIERIVTVSGDCVKSPGNYLVRVGTLVKDLVEKNAIEFSKEPKKIILGGPMMGLSQPDMEVPVIKSTSGVLFLSNEKAPGNKETACIRCAKCVDACPVRLIPTDIMRNAKRLLWDNVGKMDVTDCIECGACAYMCPARIPLVQYMKEGKAVQAAKRK